VLATAQGKKLGLLNFKHPLADVDPGYDRLARLPGRLRHRRRRHRHRALGAGLRRGRLQQLRGPRPGYDDILNPVQGNGTTRPTAAVRRPAHLEGRPVIIEALRTPAA
jgi:isoleucyl-tRNA synthetase